jgi:single-strand DNA-binding protein
MAGDMMAERSLNRVMLIGRLGANVEAKQTQNGTPFSRFSVATNRRWKDGNQEVREETDWHNVILWRSDNLTPYLTRGEKVYVDGRLQTRHWEDNEGRKHSASEIVADQVILLGGNPQRGGNGKGQTSAPAPGQPRTRAQSPRPGKGGRPQPPAAFGQGMTDDDVSFDRGLRSLC